LLVLKDMTIGTPAATLMAQAPTFAAPATWPRRLTSKIEAINRELLLLLSLFLLAALVNAAVASHRMVLSLYALPTLFSAYTYGRRHATLTAVASVLMVVLLQYANPGILPVGGADAVPGERWLDLAVWGGGLVVTGYLMGTLYDHKEAQMHELRETYHGVLLILRHVISHDKYTEHHSYRVSVYATILAEELGLSDDRVEDVRAAALLHDIGKLGMSRALLYKAASLTEEEHREIRRHVTHGVEFLQPVGGSLRRIIPIVLAHHEKFDGTGYHGSAAHDIPIEARIISVADVYDAVTSDRPYRKAMGPLEAKDMIVRGSEADFDPDVVRAFVRAFQAGRLDNILPLES
jgi:putative nucleotidyltransferase with HDIG domain